MIFQYWFIPRYFNMQVKSFEQLIFIFFFFFFQVAVWQALNSYCFNDAVFLAERLYAEGLLIPVFLPYFSFIMTIHSGSDVWASLLLCYTKKYGQSRTQYSGINKSKLLVLCKNFDTIYYASWGYVWALKGSHTQLHRSTTLQRVQVKGASTQKEHKKSGKLARVKKILAMTSCPYA